MSFLTHSIFFLKILDTDYCNISRHWQACITTLYKVWFFFSYTFLGSIRQFSIPRVSAPFSPWANYLYRPSPKKFFIFFTRSSSFASPAQSEIFIQVAIIWLILILSTILLFIFAISLSMFDRCSRCEALTTTSKLSGLIYTKVIK